MNSINDLLAKATPQQEQRIHDRMMLAARIDDALTAQGWTQKELAAKMGKQPSEVSKWLSGTHNFTIDTLSDLSQILGVKLLCVREEAPKQVIKQVIRYRPILLAVYHQKQGFDTVPFASFQSGIGQSLAPQQDA